MSQHALRLARAIIRMPKHQIESVSRSEAVDAMKAYLTSDEYREDLQCERARVGGFQGLAGEGDAK